MEHWVLWNAISTLAARHGMTCSGLARFCGLDANTFNKSKQFSDDGTPRWPSCRTIARVLTTLHMGPVEFVELCMSLCRHRDTSHTATQK